jgi:EthD domain
MISYFVRYRGSSPDPVAFYGYYENRHADILREFPAIRSLVLHTPVTWADPFPVKSGGSALVAQMIFDTAGDLDAALRSIARRRARDDFGRFPPFEGEVTHEAMAGKTIF